MLRHRSDRSVAFIAGLRNRLPGDCVLLLRRNLVTARHLRIVLGCVVLIGNVTDEATQNEDDPHSKPIERVAENVNID